MGESEGFYLLKYGSMVNGLANQGESDLDLTIISSRSDLNHELVLLKIKAKLVENFSLKRFDFADSYPNKIMAGWILQFKDLEANLSIDIMINKRAEVLNSILLHQYCELDSRFQQVAKVLKKWNSQLQLPKHDQLNNYSLCLMLLAFMQHKNQVPNLQERPGSPPV